jgi:hypothetical protein
MTSKMLRAAAVAVAAGTTAVSVAVAAAPESGTISKAEPFTEWMGEVTPGGGAWFNSWQSDPSVPCPDQGCDPYTLTVTDAGDLVIRQRQQDLTSAGTNPEGGIRVEKPDGSYVYAFGESGPETDLVLELEGATPGDYVVNNVVSYFCCGTFAYQADAGYKGATAPPEPGGGEEAPPAQNPPPQGPPAEQPPAQQQQQQPAQQTDFALTAKARKVKRRARSFKVAVTTSRAVERVTITLKKGSRKLGSGTIAPFPGKGSVRVKASRRLARGKYKLVVVGQDGGVSVARTLSLRVR